MEIILLGCLVLLLAILTVVVVILTQSITRISRLEEKALDQVEVSTTTPTSLIPEHLQEGFEEIARKHQAHFDALLQTTISSYDKQLHTHLQAQQKKQLHEFDKKFLILSQRLDKELEKLVQQNVEDTNQQMEMLNTQTKKVNELLKTRLSEHFTEIAWQYITSSLGQSIDLHSQKDLIFEELEKNQAAIKKDYNV